MSVPGAVLVDLLCGEPPAAAHPTVWMGRLLRAGRARRRGRSPVASLLEGSLLVAGGGALTLVAAGAVERGMRMLPAGTRVAARALALKPTLSLRALLDAGREVEDALSAGNLAEARRLLGWHLVSRETAGLSAQEVAAAAIESLAENLSDGLVAPLLAFRAGGLGAAYLYRFVNTCDAMLGYRTQELEWFGKAAARADDALNLLPARLSAALIATAATLNGADGAGAVRVALRDAGLTTSPNAGWPMAAMAGALGVRLSKRDAYELNPAGAVPAVADLRRARRIVATAGILAAALTSRP